MRPNWLEWCKNDRVKSHFRRKLRQNGGMTRKPHTDAPHDFFNVHIPTFLCSQALWHSYSSLTRSTTLTLTQTDTELLEIYEKHNFFDLARRLNSTWQIARRDRSPSAASTHGVCDANDVCAGNSVEWRIAISVAKTGRRECHMPTLTTYESVANTGRCVPPTTLNA